MAFRISFLLVLVLGVAITAASPHSIARFQQLRMRRADNDTVPDAAVTTPDAAAPAALDKTTPDATSDTADAVPKPTSPDVNAVDADSSKKLDEVKAAAEVQKDQQQAIQDQVVNDAATTTSDAPASNSDDAPTTSPDAPAKQLNLPVFLRADRIKQWTANKKRALAAAVDPTTDDNKQRNPWYTWGVDYGSSAHCKHYWYANDVEVANMAEGRPLLQGFLEQQLKKLKANPIDITIMQPESQCTIKGADKVIYRKDEFVDDGGVEVNVLIGALNIQFRTNTITSWTLSTENDLKTPSVKCLNDFSQQWARNKPQLTQLGDFVQKLLGSWDSYKTRMYSYFASADKVEKKLRAQYKKQHGSDFEDDYSVKAEFRAALDTAIQNAKQDAR